MKVILKDDVENLGGPGDVVDVADGYGNNFLLPRGLAMRATRGAMKDAEAMRQARSKRDARTRGDAEQVKAALEGTVVRIQAKAGEDGTLYGSVGNTGVADAIKAATGVAIDRRKIPMERPIKHTGDFDIEIRVHADVVATVKIQVLPGA